MKNWLTRQDPQPANLTELQHLLDAFTGVYNQHRPHRALPRRSTPAVAYLARPKACPTTDRAQETHYRVLHDIIDTDGKLSLRIAGRMHHIAGGAEHARTPVIKLIDGLHARIIHAATGELLRELIIDPTRDYQALGRPPGPKPGTTRKAGPN